MGAGLPLLLDGQRAMEKLKAKAKGNRTIDTPVSEGRRFLERCIRVTEPQADLSAVLGRTVWGDMLDVCGLLPPKSMDLIIADPPYNLTKSFNGRTFGRRSAADYEAYTRRWLGAVKPLLRKAEDDPSIQGYINGVFWERNTAAAQAATGRS